MVAGLLKALIVSKLAGKNKDDDSAQAADDSEGDAPISPMRGQVQQYVHPGSLSLNGALINKLNNYQSTLEQPSPDPQPAHYPEMAPGPLFDPSIQPRGGQAGEFVGMGQHQPSPGIGAQAGNDVLSGMPASMYDPLAEQLMRGGY